MSPAKTEERCSVLTDLPGYGKSLRCEAGRQGKQLNFFKKANMLGWQSSKTFHFPDGALLIFWICGTVLF